MKSLPLRAFHWLASRLSHFSAKLPPASIDMDIARPGRSGSMRLIVKLANYMDRCSPSAKTSWNRRQSNGSGTKGLCWTFFFFLSEQESVSVRLWIVFIFFFINQLIYLDVHI